jgi:hypothetical protein
MEFQGMISTYIGFDGLLMDFKRTFKELIDVKWNPWTFNMDLEGTIPCVLETMDFQMTVRAPFCDKLESMDFPWISK